MSSRQVHQLQSPPGEVEFRSFSVWNEPGDPQRVLIIRLHAVGDVALTLPACVALKRAFPTASLDYLTSDRCTELPRSLTVFDDVFSLHISGRHIGRALRVLSTGRLLRKNDYDVVVDLQRNWMSRAIRRMIRPNAWGEFDRFSPLSASDRTLETFQQTGFHRMRHDFHMPFRDDVVERADLLLTTHGFDASRSTIVLNPAGLWPTRNWPLENYFRLAHMLIREQDAQIAVLGDERLRDIGSGIHHQFPDRTVNLVEKTSLSAALAILRKCDGMVTEDSGLMHMAWSLGIPTVALFGSSNHVWSAPVGDHTRTLHSGDLACGACMDKTCKFGDVHCLTRYSPELVLKLLNEVRKSHGRETNLS